MTESDSWFLVAAPWLQAKRVSNKSARSIAEWCGGTVVTTNGGTFVHRLHADGVSAIRAYKGMWVVRYGPDDFDAWSNALFERRLLVAAG